MFPVVGPTSAAWRKFTRGEVLLQGTKNIVEIKGYR
jgi:hypothetical protein